ncbi:hypothetical protein [Janibacter cremeus]|uniref:Uncharacterized protein n=1 Tax=Janibacter cremeus TaxID=1285192 RepID=A0A852VSX3_9MICO|nr:hypothetical protein [Janibacter cremeus]NYF98530.1 hypothetical protein [Janibacter cremeus]
MQRQPKSQVNLQLLTNRMNDFTSLNKQVQHLRQEGFREVSPPADAPKSSRFFEKSVDGGRIGWQVVPDADKNAPERAEYMTQAGIGWDWAHGGPYVYATYAEWQDIIQYGATAAPALCAAIGSLPGAIACGAAGAAVAKYINSQPEAIDAGCLGVNAQLNAFVC